MRHLARRVFGVDGHPHQFRTGLPQLVDLLRGPFRIGRVRVGHRLHDHRGATADLHMADLDPDARAPRQGR